MLQEITAPFYFGMAAIIFILQWLYVMFGTFRKRKPNIECIEELNRFIEETFASETEAYLFLLILVDSMIWPITLIIVAFVIIASIPILLARTIINKRMKKQRK